MKENKRGNKKKKKKKKKKQQKKKKKKKTAYGNQRQHTWKPTITASPKAALLFWFLKVVLLSICL